jgi:hypothetical protein
MPNRNLKTYRKVLEDRGLTMSSGSCGSALFFDVGSCLYSAFKNSSSLSLGRNRACLPVSGLGLRDRALIGLFAYSFARVDAVLQMKVVDYFVQGRRRWVRLHEKGGKEHDVPCHHNLDHFLDEYIAAADIAVDRREEGADRN